MGASDYCVLCKRPTPVSNRSFKESPKTKISFFHFIAVDLHTLSSILLIIGKTLYIYPGAACIISVNVINPVARVVALIGCNTWSNEGNTAKKKTDIYINAIDMNSNTDTTVIPRNILSILTLWVLSYSPHHKIFQTHQHECEQKIVLLQCSGSGSQSCNNSNSRVWGNLSFPEEYDQ